MQLKVANTDAESATADPIQSLDQFFPRLEEFRQENGLPPAPDHPEGVYTTLDQWDGFQDELSGSYGDDRMRGGDGNDTISGGSYNDRIFGGAGRDTIDADRGLDYVNVADGRLDSVSCGPGEDTAVVDRVDLAEQSVEDFVRLSSCENVTVR